MPLWGKMRALSRLSAAQSWPERLILELFRVSSKFQEREKRLPEVRTIATFEIEFSEIQKKVASANNGANRRWTCSFSIIQSARIIRTAQIEFETERSQPEHKIFKLILEVLNILLIISANLRIYLDHCSIEQISCSPFDTLSATFD